jgi:glyoxylase-like metal-dependent hydrolase (beta-lactamase superfamily II)
VSETPFLPQAPWLRRLPVRTPTLPPATHTNVYVVGEERLLVVDPASPWPEEQAALDRFLDELPGRVEAIALTHHHLDHVSGAGHLARRLGVPIAAHAETARRLDGRLAIDRPLDEGQRLPYGPAGLLVLHTPGHAPGHVVLIDEHSGSVIAGDMVASIGTIIIDPPDGDMAVYLASLERLRTLAARRLLPAHGDPIDDPERLLSFYIAHRLEREARVVAALAAGAAPVDELVPRAYPDVAPALYPLAARSLLAHLIKLRDEGRAIDNGDVWAPR